MGHHSPREHASGCGQPSTGLTLRRDGVDGTAIYLYGEGWNFGEVADDARFVQATQLNLAGTGIGIVHRPAARRRTRWRAVRRQTRASRASAPGCSPTPTATPVNGTADEQRARLLHAAGPGQARPGRQPARLRVPSTRSGETRRRQGRRLQRPTGGLRRRPERDGHLRRRPRQRDAVRRARLQAAAGHVDGRPGADEHRVAVHGRALAGRGVLARGHRPAPVKSLDRNSYDSGDWFNRVDWSRQEHTLRLRAAAAGRQRGQVGRSCGRCSPTRRSSPGRRPMDAATRGGQDLLRIRIVVAAVPARVGGARSRRRCRSSTAAPGVDRDADRRHGGRRCRPGPRRRARRLQRLPGAADGHGHAAAAGRCTRCRPPAATRS